MKAVRGETRVIHMRRLGAVVHPQGSGMYGCGANRHSFFTPAWGRFTVSSCEPARINFVLRKTGPVWFDPT